MSEKVDVPFGNAAVDIERVIDGNDVNLFNVKVDILYKTSILFKNQSVVEYELQGPVYDSAKNVIGAASLSQENNAIVADIYLDPATPERLSLETDSQKLWPHVVGYGGFLGNFRITGVILLPHMTDDINIKAINA